MSTRPSSWPVNNAGLWATLLVGDVLEEAAKPSLPDDSWPALIAAAAAFGDLGKKDRTRLVEDLARHSPEAEGFAKRLSLPKGCAAAKAAGLDMLVFCQAMLTIDPVKGVTEAMKHIEPEQLFAALADCQRVELRLTSKALPPGLSKLKAVETLTLLKPKKLRAAANAAELATLPQRPALVLAFDGKPDEMNPPLFKPPKLELLQDAQLRTLGFETTGSPVRLALDDLAPLGKWQGLERLSLRATTLAGLTTEELAKLRNAVPGLKTLVLSSNPQPGWQEAWPGLELLVGADHLPAQ